MKYNGAETVIPGGRLATGPVVVLLGIAVAACGGAAKHRPQIANTTRTATAMPAELVVSGDDDNDDYATRHFGDGDYDDAEVAHRDRDGDADNRSGSYFDGDDASVRRFGIPATSAEMRTIAALVRRYLVGPAVSADGARACAMLDTRRVKEIPEDFGRFGPPFVRGDTCATVMTKILQVNHRQLSAHVATLLRTSNVRVKQDIGLVTLVFKRLPGREMVVYREGGVWKLDSLLENELP